MVWLNVFQIIHFLSVFPFDLAIQEKFGGTIAFEAEGDGDNVSAYDFAADQKNFR